MTMALKKTISISDLRTANAKSQEKRTAEKAAKGTTKKG